MIQSFKDLIVWQKAMEMASMTYSLTKNMPKEELFSLTNQMRRAAVSIPSNIAEGYGRNSAKEYLQFLAIARGSLCELETQLLLCVRIDYLTEQEIQPIMDSLAEIGKMLMSIIKKLKNTIQVMIPKMD